ncbi:N-acetyltransferase [Oxalobacteraceae bacterium OM1]|nr:N-acetyltransferase [Oxalobacteraceae bacterium OM1]
MHPITGDGLCLRPLTAHDVGEFALGVRESLATVGAWMPWCHAGYTTAEAQAWFRLCEDNMVAGLAWDLGIFLEDGRFCGGTGINQVNRLANMANVGYWIREPMQGRGIAARAVRLLVPFAFDALKLTRLEIIAAEHNLASRRTAEKAGAQLECIARNRLVVHGTAVPAAVYSIVP